MIVARVLGTQKGSPIHPPRKSTHFAVEACQSAKYQAPRSIRSAKKKMILTEGNKQYFGFDHPSNEISTFCFDRITVEVLQKSKY